MKHETTCAVCDTHNPVWAWTDTHGIAQCRCGTPYRLYHYDAENNSVDKAPECCVMPAWIPLLRRYRADTGKIIPGGHSFDGGQERAQPSDFRAFNEWCDAHRSEIPKREEKEAA